MTDLARHAIRLAKLEPVYRAGLLDAAIFDEPDSEDVEDILELLAIVPFPRLIHDQVMILNPDFDKSSRLMGGADADLIAGDTLIDFKVTRTDAMRQCDLDQLFGYYLLARNQRRLDSSFPAIDAAALYFARQGYFWKISASVWTEHPEFAQFEKWFLKHANEVH